MKRILIENCLCGEESFRNSSSWSAHSSCVLVRICVYTIINKGAYKMLTIFTIVVCALSYLMNISAFFTYSSYVIAFAILKAFLSKKLKDVFNIRKAEAIYIELGLMNTLDSFISLLFITLYYVFREYEHFGIEYMLPVLLCYILIYRFLFWDIGYKVKQLFRKSHQ